MKTLSEKQAELRRTVGIPTADDWHLIEDNEETAKLLLSELNAVLVAALELAKSGCATWGQIADEVFPKLADIEVKYQNPSILDSEGYVTVARFFALNYSPAMYDYLRYYGAKG